MSLFTKCNILKLSSRLQFVSLEGPENAICVQIVRWRKRRWTPVSQTKQFYVPERTVTDPEETAELKRRQSHYNTTVRAIRSFICERAKVERALKTSKATVDKAADDFAHLLVHNLKWNEQSTQLRETRLALAAKEQEEAMLQGLLRLDEEDKARKLRANAVILREKEAQKSFITEESLDDAIEEALNQRKNYNFVIDPSGNKYVEQSDQTLLDEASAALSEQSPDPQTTKASL